jgi:hypothetical protein
MEKENYRIEEYWHNEVTAFASAFGILGEREYPKEDFAESTDFNNLESSLPPDTIQVATFLYKEYSTKKIYFYVCSFPEPHPHYSYSLFSIMWSRDNLWELNAWYCCSVKSEQPQPSLHKEAANWMLKEMTTKGCAIAPLEVFKKGTLEILI